MKLVFLKLSALLVIIVGIALVGQYVQCPYVCSYVAKTTDGSLDVFFPGSFKLLSGIVFLLIGIYAFLPSFRSSKPAIRIIKQNLENGVSEINLATLEKECETMLKKVAPIKQVTVSLNPSKDQKKVCVEVNPVVIMSEGDSLPDIQEMIIQRVNEFLNAYFGLSILTPVVLKIDNFQLDGDKIYASLGKTITSSAVWQKSEGELEETTSETPHETQKMAPEKEESKPTNETTTSDYLTCKLEEPIHEEKITLERLSDKSEELTPSSQTESLGEFPLSGEQEGSMESDTSNLDRNDTDESGFSKF